ncbi:cell wall hydrolase [Taklimakanibacter lacteus]|uniref:cell wall hydrolase n=1 Tax=Taklimakanibacter lacteus TaxID=2268456 RepID=UPI000E67219A
MKAAKRAHRQFEPDYDEPLEPEKAGALSYVPYAFAGAMLVASFAFAGHYMGRNADAHSLVGEDEPMMAVASPVSTLIQKGSLMPSDATLDLINLPITREQEVMSTAKGDYISPEPDVPEVVQQPAPQKIEKRLAMTPPVWKLESTFKLKRNEKQKIVAQRRLAMAEENCLAKAVYFEARSESELGQLAVAKVVLNRVKDPNYPKTICGVVYQGSDRRNSCQFSFACDGVPDEVKSKAAWDRSKLVAQKAIAGDQTIRVIGAATNYHADYVRPKWAKEMRKLIKIGRHIFYSDS